MGTWNSLSFVLQCQDHMYFGCLSSHCKNIEVGNCNRVEVAETELSPAASWRESVALTMHTSGQGWASPTGFVLCLRKELVLSLQFQEEGQNRRPWASGSLPCDRAHRRQPAGSLWGVPRCSEEQFYERILFSFIRLYTQEVSRCLLGNFRWG